MIFAVFLSYRPYFHVEVIVQLAVDFHQAVLGK